MDAKRTLAEVKFRIRFFLALLLASYVILKLIVYLTRVLAVYFMSGTWKFF